LTVLWSSLPCFFTFCSSAIPTSCYIFNAFYYLFVIFLAAGACLSWGLPSHSRRSLSTQGSIYIQLNQVLATLAVSAEESLTQASVQTLSQFFPGWMTKPALPVRRLGVPIDQAFKKVWIIFIHSFRYIHIYDRDLPQSFQVPCSIDNTRHTRIHWFFNPMPSCQVHTTVFLIQRFRVIISLRC